jgi:hypothetical protein
MGQRQGSREAQQAFDDMLQALERYLGAIGAAVQPVGYVLAQLGPHRYVILCLRCGWVSHNQNDVANKYCGHCHVFHEEG